MKSLQDKFDIKTINALATSYSDSEREKEIIFEEGINYLLDKYNETGEKHLALIETIKYMTEKNQQGIENENYFLEF